MELKVGLLCGAAVLLSVTACKQRRIESSGKTLTPAALAKWQLCDPIAEQAKASRSRELEIRRFLFANEGEGNPGAIASGVTRAGIATNQKPSAIANRLEISDSYSPEAFQKVEAIKPKPVEGVEIPSGQEFEAFVQDTETVITGFEHQEEGQSNGFAIRSSEWHRMLADKAMRTGKVVEATQLGILGLEFASFAEGGQDVSGVVEGTLSIVNAAIGQAKRGNGGANIPQNFASKMAASEVMALGRAVTRASAAGNEPLADMFVAKMKAMVDGNPSVVDFAIGMGVGDYTISASKSLVLGAKAQTRLESVQRLAPRYGEFARQVALSSKSVLSGGQKSVEVARADLIKQIGQSYSQIQLRIDGNEIGRILRDVPVERMIETGFRPSRALK